MGHCYRAAARDHGLRHSRPGRGDAPGQRVCVLRDGVLQQVDTPQDLFDHPLNLFVAGFIGSPSMSIVEARLERADGLVTAAFAAYSLRPPVEHKDAADLAVDAADGEAAAWSSTRAPPPR